MRHTVEIADSAGKTMQLSVYVDSLDSGGSWRSIDKGMIRHNSGSLEQLDDVKVTFDVQLCAGGAAGIVFNSFVSWGTVNDQGTGTVHHTWVIGLAPGAIEWTIV